MTPRVVITGFGVVSPNGIGKEAFCRAILAGKSGVKRIARFDPELVQRQQRRPPRQANERHLERRPRLSAPHDVVEPLLGQKMGHAFRGHVAALRAIVATADAAPTGPAGGRPRD